MVFGVCIRSVPLAPLLTSSYLYTNCSTYTIYTTHASPPDHTAPSSATHAQVGGLKLLLPLTESEDTEVQRLAAHALANLSVNAENQVLMAAEGGIEMLVHLVKAEGENCEAVHRQASKALANLGVNSNNKELISKAGGIAPLIELAKSRNMSVSVEAIAALANLAVNDNNEVEIAELGGLAPILDGANTDHLDLQSQSARALRNLSVNEGNKEKIIALGGVNILKKLIRNCPSDRVRTQASRALANLGADDRRDDGEEKS